MGSSLERAKRCSCWPKYSCQRRSPVKLWFPVSTMRCKGISGSSCRTHSAAPISWTRIAVYFDKGRSSSSFMQFSNLLSVQRVSHCKTGDNPDSSAASVKESRESVSSLPHSAQCFMFQNNFTYGSIMDKLQRFFIVKIGVKFHYSASQHTDLY